MLDEMIKRAKILIVDDQAANVSLLERILEREGFTNVRSTVDSRQALAVYAEFAPDLILLDLLMPHMDGFAVLKQLRPLIPADSYLPILVLTADITAVAKQRALVSGAKDFLTKPLDVVEVLLRIGNLLVTRFLHLQLQNQNQILEAQVRERTAELTRANAELRTEIAERKQAEEALEHNYSLLHAVIEGTPDSVYVKDLQGRYLMVNSACADLLGLSVAEVLGKDDSVLFAADSARRILEIDRRIMERGDTETYESTATAGGVTRTYLSMKGPYRDQQGNVIGVIGISHDITERKQLEVQLLQSQKMETIGHLAGGIAHDFNNMLSAIIGQIGFVQEELPQNTPTQHALAVAEGAAWRAARLTRQLLAFARKQIVEPHVLNLNDVIVELDKLLRQLIGEDIELVTLPAADLGQVKADPGQIEQVIANLVVNARDAMPQGGQLTIETTNTVLDATYARQHVGAAPGEYVMLAVSDTGCGMDADVQQHIFEPFYTTKEVGKGTGLGLATCYGIVKQHGGNIWVYSEVGHGTTFKVYLPRVYEAADSLAERADEALVPRGTEMVLLVEDEPLVREVASDILHAQGYIVLEAINGEDALRVVQEHAGANIDILITDAVMPRLSGKALAEQVSSLYPSIKVLFISGYATDAITHHGQLAPGTNFLSKPFTRVAFARKVREVLDAAANSTTSAMN
jgi:two-component system cell cycle sensor histidine kinase/response regulator CckA